MCVIFHADFENDLQKMQTRRHRRPHRRQRRRQQHHAAVGGGNFENFENQHMTMNSTIYA